MAGQKGKQGRKRLPTAVKAARGTLQPCRTNPDEPSPEVFTKAPPCPKILQGEARIEWQKRSRALAQMRVLTEGDLLALEAHCVVVERWRTAESALRIQGLQVCDEKGNIENNPLLKVVDKCLEQMRAYLTEFGLTPSSRSRVKAAPPKAKPQVEDTVASRLFGAPLN